MNLSFIEVLQFEKSDSMWQVTNNTENVSEGGGSTEEELADKSKNIDPSSTSQTKLYNRLRAVKFEIDAVASTFEQVKNVASSEDHDDDDKAECGDREDDELVSPIDFTLQQALAADRLKCLKRTKVQIEKELSDLQEDDATKGMDYENLLADMVKEESRPKRKAKKVQKPGKKRQRSQKTVSFTDDTDFDATLDAVSAGFVETVS